MVMFAHLHTNNREQCPSVSTGGGWPTAQCGLTKGHAGSHEAHVYGEGGLLSWPDGAKGTTSGAMEDEMGRRDTARFDPEDNVNERKRTMAKYRKRPVVIEAVQFDKSGAWPDGVEPYDPVANRACLASYPYAVAAIHTLEGWHIVSDGDFVITGVNGERCPCKPDIFAATYEAVD